MDPRDRRPGRRADPAIAAALFTRFSSSPPDAFGNGLLAALRQQFGGHAVHTLGQREDL